MASVTRIVDHLLGRAACKACTGDTDNFYALCEKLRQQADAKDERKKRKLVKQEVKERTAPVGFGGKAPSGQAPNTQTKLLMKRSAQVDADDAVARFFYGNNIPTQMMNSRTFRDLIDAIRVAPLDWKPPERHRLAGPLLDRLVGTLRAQEAPLRQSVFKNCGTVLSDGWDGVGRSHLINQLVGNAQGVFFDGTVELQSTDHEDAAFVSGISFRLSLIGQAP